MKIRQFLIILTCAFTGLFLTGCKSSKNGNVWDDNQTSGNYKGNARTLWGNSEVASADEFFGPSEDDFIALNEDDLKKTKFFDGAIPQPRGEPGEKGSGLPGIDGFRQAKGELASIFKTVFFNTDDHILRGKDFLATIDRISDYLKSHKDVYVFVEGNCDERGPEAYNLSLGSRRANYIRTLLVQKGVDSERIHTVSYGKERPSDFGHGPDAWQKNRRAEFKIYQKS